MTARLFQPYGSDGEWRLTTDSDRAGNTKPQNKRHSQLVHMAMRGRAPIDWGSKATAVQTVRDLARWIRPLEHSRAAGRAAEADMPPTGARSACGRNLSGSGNLRRRRWAQSGTLAVVR